MSDQDAIQKLYQLVQSRPRPEDVANLILETLDAFLSSNEKGILKPAAGGIFSKIFNPWWNGSSMSTTFAKPIGAAHQIKTAEALFGVSFGDGDMANPWFIKRAIETMRSILQAKPGETHFTTNRLGRKERKAAGITINHRQYNKRFRALARMEDKLARMSQNDFKYDLARMSKSGLATSITLEHFEKDLNTACFIAYLSARMNKRSIFTNDKQERAFDTIAEMLYRRAIVATPNWYAIALVHPEPEVLAHLTDAEKASILLQCFNTLNDIATWLRSLWKEGDINLRTMIVRKGNNSSDWNQAAGSWNKMRDVWVSMIYALGLDRMLDHMCPGKVLRLMAGDVVFWHTFSKGSVEDGIDPDTKVWRDLPMPWEVIAGEKSCPRSLVEETCDKHNVKRTGWCAPRPGKIAVEYKPTPELVHGVSISSPWFASALKQAGYFSGKEGGTTVFGVDIVRDENGFALKAKPTEEVMGTL